MNAKKILALMLCAMMLLSLAACGAKGNDKQADMSGDGSAMTGEPKTAVINPSSRPIRASPTSKPAATGRSRRWRSSSSRPKPDGP